MNIKAWAPTWRGLTLIAELELKQRVRATKWKWALAAFFLLVGAVSTLIWGVTGSVGMSGGSDRGYVVDIIVYFVLGLGLLVSPTLSATAINGDSKEGTLAPLQATALTAGDIVFGKVVASWLASLSFLVVASPFMIFSYVQSDWTLGAFVIMLLVLAAQLFVVCALGIGWSALTARTSASAVLTYVTVATLTIILPILMALSLQLVTSREQVTIYDIDYSTVDDPWANLTDEDYNTMTEADYARLDREYQDAIANATCRESTQTQDVLHTERIWWMVAVNPFVIVSDAVPLPVAQGDDYYYAGDSPMRGLKWAVRELRAGEQGYRNWGCGYLEVDYQRDDELRHQGLVWPFGLAIQGLLAAGALTLAVRRVQVPYGVLASGTRVA